MTEPSDLLTALFIDSIINFPIKSLICQ